MKKVITYGTFDLLHVGHINILKRAKEHGDYLIVGVTGEQYDMDRGKLNVEQSLEERMANVLGTGLADKIIVETREGQKLSDIQEHDVDVFVIGSDWKGKFEHLKEFCEVVYLPRTPDISSTDLREARHKTIRIGIVGAGRIASRFVPESKYVSGCLVAGVCSRDVEKAKEFAESFELNFSTEDYSELLEKVDAVYIATPHRSHFPMAKEALEKGKHVLCEKPITLTRAELQQLFDLADAKGALLMEAVKTAYAPGFMRLVEMAKSGVIGAIKDVDASFTKLVEGLTRELDPSNDGGSVNELATYPLLAIIQLLGVPRGMTFHSYFRDGVDLYTRGILDFDHAVASFKVGLGVKTEGDLIVSGTKGYLYAPAPWWKTQEFEIRLEDSRKNMKYFYRFDGEGLRYELAEFVKLIKDDERESWKLKRKTSLGIVGVIEAFSQGVRDGKVVSL